MPHADSSSFANGLSKTQVYAEALANLKALLDGSHFWVSNLANAASLLWYAFHSLPEPSASVNWAGFYVRADAMPISDPSKQSVGSDTLVLGPFHGKPACQAIKVGRGVCGTAAEQKTTVSVADVLSFPGHIACDGDSRSEIVVPLLVNGEVVAIIDIDCTRASAFDEQDKEGLESIAAFLAQACDWGNLTSRLQT